jgi:hypothetical protein
MVVMPTAADAWALCGRGDFRGAADLSARLLAADPENASALCCLAMCHWQLGIEPAKCLGDLRRAVQLAPEEAPIHHNLATVLASEGQIAEACEHFLKALELKPDDAEAFFGLSQNYCFIEESDLIRSMLAYYSSGQFTPRAREFACFALAKAFSDLGQPDRAMHFCLEGNRLVQRSYDAELPRANLAELRSMAARDAFRGIAPGSFAPAATPLFVVGMPRSGTTLVESILARHPHVHAGGETMLLIEVEQALFAWCEQQLGYSGGPYEMLAEVPQDYFTRNAEAVMRRVEAAAGGRAFSAFTDKLPENTQRLGLVGKLFPTARVIYVRRHPLDCCISNLFQHFAHGNGFAFSQTLLGERYRQVADTMELWRGSLDLPILDVSYELLTADPEPQIRRLLGFAGLEWDPACLTPERAQRRIMTASQYQVRQPINRGSVDRWRPFEAWIQPLIAAMGGLAAIEDEQRRAEIAGAHLTIAPVGGHEFGASRGMLEPGMPPVS